MLDPWIIEEILKREEELRKEQGIRIELPLDRGQPKDSDRPRVQPPAEERGVMIIDI